MHVLVRAWASIRGRLTGNGAGATGLAAMTDVNFAAAACDAMVTVALASTLFFAVPTGQARGRVALYLLTTVAPFAVVAPVIGPLLDRVGRYRRLALAVTLVVRAVLAWLMARHAGGLTLYPLALGLLVFSKGFGVARSAIVPRLVPDSSTLVAVNSRLQLASTIGSVIAAPIALGVSHLLGAAVLLRVSTFAYLATTALILRLPDHVDIPRQPEERGAKGLPGAVLTGHARWFLGNLPAALRDVLPMRALVGFLTLFLAFYLRGHGHGTAALGLLAGGVAAGNVLGLVLGRATARRRPELLIRSMQLLSALSCLIAAVFFSLDAALALATGATLASVTAKLALDAVIQRDIPEATRSSAFGRSETSFQLAWVVGGALGLIPLPGRVGFEGASAAMLVVVIFGLRRRRGHVTTRSPLAAPAAQPQRPARPARPAR